MDNYSYLSELEKIWRRGVESYKNGNTQLDDFFDPEESAFIHAIGATDQEVFDFIEDFARRGEPDFGTFAVLQDIRRNYFLEVQGAKVSDNCLDPETLPEKSAELEGIRWLPRLIEKAKAKLKGELHPNVMFGCGGDRGFFKEHNIHPADFFRKTWEFDGDPEKIANWVKQRKSVKIED